MPMTYEEIDSHLTYIMSGVKYLKIDAHVLLFKYPTNQVKQRAQLEYNEAFEAAKSIGVLPAKDLEDLLNRRSILTQKDLAKIKKLKGQLEAQQYLLSKTTVVKANQDRIKGVIARIRGEIRDIESKRTSKMLMSAENKAEEARTFFICSMCVYKEDGTLFWESYEAAKLETRADLRNKIMYAYLRFYSGLSTPIIREIARSGVWRIRYINSIKTSDPLFGKPSSDYTTDQLNLTYWSNHYQNIYEMMPEDRPSDDTIEDDDALDAYMKSYYEERTRQDAARKAKKKQPFNSKLSAFNSDEIVVTKSHELYHNIKYNKPLEASRLKDKGRVDIKKRAKPSMARK